MRIIYTDEAGTTSEEPVRVVAGLIVNPDIHWFPVIRRLHQVWDQHIPSEYRRQNRHNFHSDFTFHAKRVSRHKDYPNWPEAERFEFLKAMMAIPGEFEIPICIAAVRSGAIDWSGWPEKERRRMTPVKSDHMSAFAHCLAEANKFIKSNYPDELAQVVSDSHQEMPEIFKKALNLLQGSPMPVEIYLPREGREPQARTELMGADRIIDEVYFMESRNAPFLQLVDACVFGLRRSFAGLPRGEDYLRAIAGGAGMRELPADWTIFFGTIHRKKLVETRPPVVVIESPRPIMP